MMWRRLTTSGEKNALRKSPQHNGGGGRGRFTTQRASKLQLDGAESAAQDLGTTVSHTHARGTGDWEDRGHGSSADLPSPLHSPLPSPLLPLYGHVR